MHVRFHKIYTKLVYRVLLPGALIALVSVLPSVTRAETYTLDQWLDLGWDYYNAGNLEEAFNTFLQATGEYPESAEAHLALGEMYFEMDNIERGRNEVLYSLQLDDETSTAARAHYVYALSIREEDPWEALLHLDRAHHLGGSPSLHFEIGQQTRFCRLLIRLTGRSEEGPVVLHFADYLMEQEDADLAAVKVNEDLYLTEIFCSFEMVEPIHIFLYSSERAVRAEILRPEDDFDPVHREYHVPYSPDYDYAGLLSVQIVYDMQQELNRHAGASWITFALPGAIRGVVEWDAPEDAVDVPGDITVDSAVRALRASNEYIELKYLVIEEYSPYIPATLARAELASFLTWIRREYPTEKFQELLTQPNIEIVLDDDFDNIENRWLTYINSSPSLIDDPELALRWVDDQPISPLSGDPELPAEILREGLRLYLTGQVAHGMWEIRRALEIDPTFGLGYYTLGWIAYSEGDWDTAQENLQMAVILFENPVQIAWCHTMLAPLYLNIERWDLAYASLNIVANNIDSEETRLWAMQLLPRVSHIIALNPVDLSRDSDEFNLMRTFITEWNQASNSDEEVSELISDMMDDSRIESLSGFYSAIRNEYPTVVFNHAVNEVGSSGYAYYVKVIIQAAFPDLYEQLPPNLQPLETGGYTMYFQVIPSEDGYRVFDWEDASFPLSNTRIVRPEELDIETLVNEEA